MLTWTNTSSIRHSNCREDHMLLLGRCQRFFRLKRTQQIIKFPQLITWVIAPVSAKKKHTTKKQLWGISHETKTYKDVLHYHNILFHAQNHFFLDEKHPRGSALAASALRDWTWRHLHPKSPDQLNDLKNREVRPEVAPENQLLQ